MFSYKFSLYLCIGIQLCLAPTSAARHLALFFDYRDAYAGQEAHNGFGDEQFTPAEEQYIRSFRTTQPEYIAYSLYNEQNTNLAYAPFTRLLACALAEQSTPLVVAGKHLLHNIALLANTYQQNGGLCRDSSSMALYCYVMRTLEQHWVVYEQNNAYLLIPKQYHAIMMPWFNLQTSGMLPIRFNATVYQRTTQPNRHAFGATVVNLIDQLITAGGARDPWICCLFGHGTRLHQLGGIPVTHAAQLLWTLQDKNTTLCHACTCYFGQTKLAYLQAELARQAAGRRLNIAIGSGATTDAPVMIYEPNFDPQSSTIDNSPLQLKTFFDQIQTWATTKTIPSPHLYAAGNAIAVRLCDSLCAPNIPHMFLPDVTETFVPIARDPELLVIDQESPHALTKRNVNTLLVYRKNVQQTLSIINDASLPSCVIIPVGNGNTVTHIASLSIGHHSLVDFVTGLSNGLTYVHQPKIFIKTLQCGGIAGAAYENQAQRSSVVLHNLVIEHIESNHVLVSFEQDGGSWRTWLLDSYDLQKTMPILPRIDGKLDPQDHAALRHAGLTQVTLYTPGSNGIGLQKISLA